MAEAGACGFLAPSTIQPTSSFEVLFLIFSPLLPIVFLFLPPSCAQVVRAMPHSDEVVRTEGLATINFRLLVNMLPKMAAMGLFVFIYSAPPVRRRRRRR